MKKIIGILAIAFTFVSCTSNDEIILPETPNCNCWTVISNNSFNVVNSQGSVYIYHVNQLRNDCSFQIKSQESNLVVGTKKCN